MNKPQASRTPHRLAALIAGVLITTTTQALAQTASEKAPPTVATLIDRPDLRPDKVTAMREFRFGSGDVIAKGAELSIHELRPDAIVLDNGAFIFEAKIEDTDLLDRAAKLIGGLSEEAMALTLSSLERDNSLWPARVSLNNTMQFSDGTTIRAGETLALRNFARGQLTVHHAPTDVLFTLEPASTDILAQARSRTATPKEQRRPHFVRSLEAALVPDDKQATQPLDGAEYILVYQGRKECSRCARFTPSLLKTYSKLKAESDNFEVVFMSQDRTERLHNEHVRDKNMPWKVLPFNKRFATPAADLQGDLLPVVYLVKPDGTVIDKTDPRGRGRSAKDVLKRLEREVG